ncbi:hypothetical protein K466DRAFT_70718 [Polyporus arcularius HHB13444]|uniref:Uncharacterized protein n=1 Tax=Polyporus arcularius HHB13444 TaxID=1314778 RepID=A0A5C3Q0N0_9APHY|nr:hypothetical protein K466DRAFT_70718 [Polyporus arcularius HHB13444]
MARRATLNVPRCKNTERTPSRRACLSDPSVDAHPRRTSAERPYVALLGVGFPVSFPATSLATYVIRRGSVSEQDRHGQARRACTCTRQRGGASLSPCDYSTACASRLALGGAAGNVRSPSGGGMLLACDEDGAQASGAIGRRRSADHLCRRVGKGALSL